MIEEFTFGSIKINGEIYEEDVMVDWEEEVKSWQRREAHLIDVNAVQKALMKFPDVIIIGTGESGVAQILDEAKQEIEKRGVELIIEETPRAVGTFNDLKTQEKKIVGLFHLTC
ncbi:MAG: MTH938/NDUFAF3 family protein [Candidatus Paceibacterota bacterium]|jgi:hypothetical protein